MEIGTNTNAAVGLVERNVCSRVAFLVIDLRTSWVSDMAMVYDCPVGAALLEVDDPQPVGLG